MQTRTALLVLAVLTAALPAQSPEQGVSGEVPFQPAQPSLIDLEFRGGSLTVFAALIRAKAAAAGQPVNIVLPSTADDVELPSIDLASATVEDALRAVGAIVPPDVQLRVQQFQSEPAATTVFTVSIELRDRQPRRERPLSLEVFSLAELVPVPFDPAGEVGVTAETALSAVDAALSMTGGGEALDSIRYHVDSKLLFVHGSADQVLVVRKVIERLRNDVIQLRVLALRQQREARSEESVEGGDQKGGDLKGGDQKGGTPEQPIR